VNSDTTRSVADQPASPAPDAPPQPSRSTSSLAITQTVVAPRSRALSRLQLFVAAVLIVLALLLAGRLWAITGLARTVRIDGPSMAPAWLGGHYQVQCGDCGLAFGCDGEHPPANGIAACPNCGYRDNPLREEDLRPGQQVLIDRWPHLLGWPQRGEVVAAADPDEPGGFVVKRVAGLPGERLAIRGGDLFADERLVRKSLRELAAVRVLVHDNRHKPQRTSGLPERWQSGRAGTGWHTAPGGYRYERPAGAVDDDRFDWLQYQHWLLFAAHSRTKLSPVLDHDSFNQSVSREQNAVTDVVLSCRIRTSGRFALAAIDGRQRFEVLFDSAAASVVLSADGREIAREEGPLLVGRRSVAIEFGLCDRQVLLAVAGREIFRHAYDRPAGQQAEPLHPLAIGTRGPELEVTDLVVWRDIYHLAPSGLPGAWQADLPLTPSQYALLGDNAAVSIDSRQWTGGVSGNRILGRVYQPFWAR
jgi:hypothetical protein